MHQASANAAACLSLGSLTLTSTSNIRIQPNMIIVRQLFPCPNVRANGNCEKVWFRTCRVPPVAQPKHRLSRFPDDHHPELYRFTLLLTSAGAVTSHSSKSSSNERFRMSIFHRADHSTFGCIVRDVLGHSVRHSLLCAPST